MIYLFNVILAMGLSAFSFGIFPDMKSSAAIYVLMFIGWYVVTWLLSFFYNKSHFSKVPKIAGLILYFLGELISASIKVAYEIVTPKDHMKPALVAISLDVKTDFEITILANLITLTPGTLSIDITNDKKTLLIHEVYVRDEDIEAVKDTIKNGFERRILQITR